MYYGNSPPSSGVLPAQDLNLKLSFNIPPEYTANVPGFLQVLFEELDKVREESSLLWAEQYGPVQSIRKLKTQPYQSNIKKDILRRRKLDELDEKEGSLMSQIQELRWLLSDEGQPETTGEGIPTPPPPKV